MACHKPPASFTMATDPIPVVFGPPKARICHSSYCWLEVVSQTKKYQALDETKMEKNLNVSTHSTTALGLPLLRCGFEVGERA